MDECCVRVAVGLGIEATRFTCPVCKARWAWERGLDGEDVVAGWVME